MTRGDAFGVVSTPFATCDGLLLFATTLLTAALSFFLCGFFPVVDGGLTTAVAAVFVFCSVESDEGGITGAEVGDADLGEFGATCAVIFTYLLRVLFF